MKEEVKIKKFKIKDIILSLIRKRSKKIYLGIFVASVVIIGAMVSLIVITNKKESQNIISTATLQKIINISELSTFQVVYNGVAEVNNKKDKDEVDYYVSYMSKVNAGINFEEVKINKDEDAKKITLTLPEVEIMDINVDITSLDYFFYNKKANDETVSEEAYKACIEDVNKEVLEKKDIYELAEDNAKNIIKALINPFLGSLDEDYELEINSEGNYD